MQLARNAKLVKLRDSTLMLEDPAHEIRGHKVVDASGEEVGKVFALFVDEQQRKVRLLEIHSGGVLGIGQCVQLVPVDAVKKIKDDTVYLIHPRQKFTGAPPYDPELVSEEYLDEMYGHYGYNPYWMPGYAYPNHLFLGG